MDIKNNILTFDGNNEKVFNNFCEIIGLQPYLIKEELINFSASYDMVSKSHEGEIKFDDSEESEVTDENDNLYKNQTMTDVPKYSPKPNEYKNSTCSKCILCVMKLLYKYNFHTAAFTNLYMTYKFILTLACTQVHCERSFSKLKIIKTRLRSSISQELLEPLLFISIESDKVPDLEEIISCYAHSSTELKKLLVY
jgi:transcriptional antiterminator